MRRRGWAPAGAAMLIALAVGAALLSSGSHASPGARAPAIDTEKVQQGPLSASVSGTGTLTYRARADGSPYAVINPAGGVYTELPPVGDEIGCGEVLYRVDDRPVVLLCGAIPAYRALHMGLTGPDVRQLNRNLHRLGYDTEAGVRVDPGDEAFTSSSERALRVFQRKEGVGVTGTLARDEMVFLPEAVRIAKVIGQLGASAQPGAPVLSATSDKLFVRVELEASQQREVRTGDRAQITLPGNTPVTGRVVGFGQVAQAGQGSQPTAATIPTFIDLGNPARADGLDQAPVEVDIATKGVANALTVPVTALVGKSGGGFAVEAIRAGGQRELVAVKLGLFDTAGGRVQVEGDLRVGDSVVVPSI